MGHSTSSGRTTESVEISVGGTTRQISKAISDAVDNAKWERDPDGLGAKMIDVPGVGRAYIAPRLVSASGFGTNRRGEGEIEVFVELPGGNIQRVRSVSMGMRNNRGGDISERTAREEAKAYLKLHAERARRGR